jgi:hypothetical protein
MLQKETLKPGMTVRNRISGHCGVLMASPSRPGELYVCADDCVYVKKKYRSGKRTGKNGYTFWSVANLELVSSKK